MIIALSGYATCGKDTVADILVEDHGFAKYAWADTLRLACQALDPIVHYDGEQEIRYNDALSALGYNEAKAVYPEFRRVLQYLGTEVGRNLIDNNVWVGATMKRIIGERSLSDDIVFTDTRFPNEALAVQARSEALGYVVRVVRPGVLAQSDHPSEISLDDWAWDYTLYNGGTIGELGDNVRIMLERLRNRD